jgi:hypothetical protein
MRACTATRTPGADFNAKRPGAIPTIASVGPTGGAGAVAAPERWAELCATALLIPSAVAPWLWHASIGTNGIPIPMTNAPKVTIRTAGDECRRNAGQMLLERDFRRRCPSGLMLTRPIFPDAESHVHRHEHERSAHLSISPARTLQVVAVSQGTPGIIASGAQQLPLMRGV